MGRKRNYQIYLTANIVTSFAGGVLGLSISFLSNKKAVD